MVALAGEIAEGLIFANASRSHMQESLSALPAEKRGDPDFLVANMIPTCISDDVEAAKAVNRRTLTRYTMLPNYRNYWKEAGYVDEMTAIEAAIAEGRQADIPSLMSDRWLADAPLFGPAATVREGIEAWREAGVTTPVIVPSSASGNQLKAVDELFAASREPAALTFPLFFFFFFFFSFFFSACFAGRSKNRSFIPPPRTFLLPAPFSHGIKQKGVRK